MRDWWGGVCVVGGEGGCKVCKTARRGGGQAGVRGQGMCVEHVEVALAIAPPSPPFPPPRHQPMDKMGHWLLYVSMIICL